MSAPSAFRSEAGGVAVMVALFFAFVALALGAVTVDLGGLFQSSRAMVTDADAAAHAGAVLAASYLREEGECPSGAAAKGSLKEDIKSEAEAAMDDNDPDSANLDIEIDSNCPEGESRGWVQVSGRQPSEGFFSGSEELRAFQSSTMLFEGSWEPLEGLAFCLGVLGAEDLKKDLNGEEITAVPYHQSKAKLDAAGVTVCGWDAAPALGSAPVTSGAWGWLDGPCGIPQPQDEEVGAWCDGKTGNELATQPPWEEGDTVMFPIYTEADGNGSDSRFLLVTYVKAEFVGACKVSGSDTLPDDPDNPDNSCFEDPNFNGNQPSYLMLKIDKGSLAQAESPKPVSSAVSMCSPENDRAGCPDWAR